MASSLIEQLPGRIAQLEAKHGPDDLYVKDLKEQLRASKATLGQTAQDVYRAQAVPVGTPTSAKLPPAPNREGYNSQEEYDEARGRWQETVGRIKGLVASQARRSRWP